MDSCLGVLRRTGTSTTAQAPGKHHAPLASVATLTHVPFGFATALSSHESAGASLGSATVFCCRDTRAGAV